MKLDIKKDKLSDLSCNQFVDELASKAPVPGGGSSCALVAALASALANMVASFTVGKKKYSQVEGEILRASNSLYEIQDNLVKLIDEDAKAFIPLSRTYSLPQTSEEEILYKEKIMEEALNNAANIPLLIMKDTLCAIKHIETMALKGSKIMISDAGTAATLARASLEGAILNVYVNTKLMKDREYAESINSNAKAILEEGIKKTNAIYDMVISVLSN